MTTPMIPDFNFKLYQDEILKVINVVVKVISDHHQIDAEKLKKTIERHADICFTIVPDDVEKVRIIKSKPRKLPEEGDRCTSHIRTPEGLFMQCRCKKADNKDNCKRHTKKPSQYGTISEPNEHHMKKDTRKKSNKIY
jgi:hypothetical protein